MIMQSALNIELVLQRIMDTPCICSGGRNVHRTTVHSKDAVMAEDLPISGKRVFLHVPKRKTVCPEDDRIRTEELARLRGRVTRPFAEHICRLTSITTNTEAG